MLFLIVAVYLVGVVAAYTLASYLDSLDGGGGQGTVAFVSLFSWLAFALVAMTMAYISLDDANVNWGRLDPLGPIYRYFLRRRRLR